MNLKPALKLIFLTLFLLAVLIGTASSGYAKANDTKWKRIKGDAIDITVSANGRVAAVDKKGQVFRYNYDGNSWTLIGRNMRRITSTPDGTFWGTDNRGNLRRFTGTQWQAVGTGANDAEAKKDGRILVTTNTKSLAVYYPATRQWSAIEGKGTHIAADDKGLIWRVAEDGTLARKLDDAWIGVEGRALDISSYDDILIVSASGTLQRWNNDISVWSNIDGIQDVASVSAGNGMIWVAQRNGDIFVMGLNARTGDNGIIEIGKPGDGGATDPSEIIDNSPIVFTAVPDNTLLDELAIGQDGSIYGLTSSGEIRRWSNNEQRFNDFPGRLERIVIQDNGLPLGIGVNENLLEHDGEAWRQIIFSQELSDLALFEDNRILAFNASDRAIRLSENRKSFEQAGGPRAQQIVAQNDGRFWLIDNVNRLFQCSSSGQCERQSTNANDISIGPADSVFIVDSNSNLRRFNPNTKAFDLIRQGDTSRVAVGPQDRPWILDNQGRVLQAGFFERDESSDRTLAIKTAATENVTTDGTDNGSGGIEIVQSIRFTAVPVPTSATGFPNLGGGLRDLTVGAGDIVLVTGFASPCVEGNGANWVYNPNTSSFGHLDYLKGVNLFTALALADPVIGDVDGDTPPTTPAPAISSFLAEWNKDCANRSNLLTYEEDIFTEPGAQASQDFNGATFGTEQPLNVIPDLDIAGDGTVVNIFGTELEFFHPETANDVEFFDQIAFMRAGVGTNEKDIWAVSTTNNVYEFVEATDSFELRSKKSGDKAQDIGVGQDGTVFIVNMSGVLKKWDPVSGLFISTTKTGVNRVAVDSKGNPIVANFPTSQTVFFGR